MVKIGVIGAGRWGKNHIESLLRIENCSLSGLADPDPKTRLLAEKFKLKYFPGYKAMLDFVDAVTVATPTDLHYSIVKGCLKEKKHVLVEKPIALKVEEARELGLLAEKYDVILKVGYLFRFNAAVLKARELIKAIGDIQSITGRYVHSTKPPRKDSGVILNFGAHHFDTLSFLLQLRPKSIYCKKSNYFSPAREDVAVAIIDYADFFASLEFSWFHPEKKRDFWIIGSKEKLYLDLGKQKIIRYPKEIGYESVKESPPFEQELQANEPLFEELKNFCYLVENNKYFLQSKSQETDKIIDFDFCLAAEMCETALESAQTGKEINF